MSTARTDRSLRALAVCGVLAVVVGFGVLDGLVHRPPAPSDVSAATPVVALGGPAQSSAWYCAGGSGSGGQANTTLTLVSAAQRPVSATVSAVTSDGAAKQQEVTVPGGGSVSLSPAALVDGTWIASTVLVHGGGLAVSQSVAGPLGRSSAPCAATAASSWDFAHGSTAGETLYLALYNPLATDAVVDVTLLSPTEGTLFPPAYQGLAVPAGALVVVSLGDHAQNDAEVATEVTALSGQVVADELDEDGQGGQSGLALELGVAAPSATWAFPSTTDVVGTTVTFHLLNPSAAPTNATLDIAIPGAEVSPVTVPLAPEATASLVAESETRIPPDTPYATVVRTSGGVGIVVSREVRAAAGAPAPVHGEAPGSSTGARRWLVPPVAPQTLWSFAVVDLAEGPVSLHLDTLEGGRPRPIAGREYRVTPTVPLELGPQPGAPLGVVPVVVDASGPVVVEPDVVPAGAPGVVVAPAVPFS